MKYLILQVLEQMVMNAADEIGWAQDELNMDTVLNDLEHEFDVVIDADTQLTTELMITLVNATIKWKNETKYNFINEDGTINM